MPDNDAMSFGEIHENLLRDLADLESESGRAKLIELLALMSFEIKRLKHRQRAYAAALRSQGAVISPELASVIEHMPRQVIIDAKDALDAIDGFYPLEYGEETAYRWTGPTSEVSFRAWIDRSNPVVLEASIYSFGDPRNHEEIRLSVDGIAVPIVCGQHVLRSDRFPTRETIAATEIVFIIPHAFSPRDVGELDERTLRIAFSQVRLNALAPGTGA